MGKELSKSEARRLFLASQGLLTRHSFGRGQAAVQRAVEQLAYVQIDTISVVERAHNHILWNRIEDYTPAMLDALQRDKRTVFEYWFHAAAYLPMRDYRFYLPLMDAFAANQHIKPKLCAEVLDRIRQEGPLKARDFLDPNHNSTGWWDFKPAKQAIEHLFRSGELMVTCREGFQKVYDLRDRVLPAGTDTRMPDRADWLRFQVLIMIRNLGLATPEQIIYQRGRLFGAPLKPLIRSTLGDLLDEGAIAMVYVQQVPYFTTAENLAQLPGRLARKRIHLLSPFDNLIIQRQRTRQLFDFDYQLECYLPADKRLHGYFALPILWGDQLAGRVDAKAERKTRVLHVFRLGLEEAFSNDSRLCRALGVYLHRFSVHHGCDEIRFHPRLQGAIASVASAARL